jgi:hypothetical protein
MKNSNFKQHDQGLLLVPQGFLEEIYEQQEQILALLSKEKEPNQTLDEFVSEADASKMLGRKTTWFWKLRKEGVLPFTKVGNKVFYSRQDILHMLKKNMKGGLHV